MQEILKEQLALPEQEQHQQEHQDQIVPGLEYEPELQNQHLRVGLALMPEFQWKGRWE